MTIVQTVTILVCLSALFSYVNHRWLKLPLTIGLMAIALVMSLVLILLEQLNLGIGQEAQAFILGIDFKDTLMHGLLSFLLFAGSLQVKLDDLFDHKWFIATLASVGVLVSTLLVGLLGYWLFGLLGVSLSLVQCLLFGALISPTDPVAVLGILKKAKVPKSLEIKITGESLFNDGMALTVFLVLFSVATKEHVTAGSTMLVFLIEGVGGAALGLAAGYGTFRMLKTIDAYQVEILMTLALVMGLYGLANALHTSGPIAVVVAGLLIGNHARELAMSPKTREYLDTFWELLDELLNAVLFVLIGLEVLVLSFDVRYVEAGLVAIPIVLLARYLSIGLPVRIFRLINPFSRRGTLIMTWGGLRGGVSVALALSLPPGRARDAIVLITYVVVVFSILVQGLTIERLIRIVGVEDRAEVQSHAALIRQV
jgi:CPA1 family monovalent cation:H+ antiporter